MPISPYYRVRITCNQQSTATSQSTTDFRIGNLAFYVNDGSVTNDKYCTAPGSFSNNGLSSATPNTSMQYIIDNYNLEDGDIIYVDTGTYPLAANIVVGTADGGDSGNPVRFVGATETDGTRLAVLDRNAAGTSTSRAIEVTGNYVRLENLRTTRGYYGISLTETGGEARNCEVYGNGNVGVNLASSANMAANCLVRNNTGTGINGLGTISGNTVQDNSGTGIYCSGGSVTGNTVHFSRVVMDVAAANIPVELTGLLTHGVPQVTGSGETRTVTVNSILGNGTLRIGVINDGHVILDINGNPLGQDYTSGPIYVIDQTPPMAEAILLPDANPTSEDAVRFIVDFSEDVEPTFNAGAIMLTGTLSGLVSNITGPNTNHTYVVTATLSDPNDDGTIGICVGTGVRDPAGNPLPAPANSDLYRIHNWFGFTQHPSPPQLAVYVGGSHTYSVACNHGNSSLAFQWKKNGIALPGGTGASLTVANAGLQDTGSYLCEVTYDGSTYSSNAGALTVADHLLITQHPEGGDRPVGESHSLCVQTTGGCEPLSYTWKKDGAVIPDATESCYTISFLEVSDAGSYVVEVADSLTDVVQSNTAVLTLAPSRVPAIGIPGMAALLGALVLVRSAMALGRKR